MRFPQPLVKGALIKRYKRFFVDASFPDGEVLTAHSVNTGAMTGVLEAGNPVWFSPADNPARKLKYTWELVQANGALVGVNTSLANKLAEEGIRNGTIRELQGYETIRREVKYGTGSRIDLLLEKADAPPCYVEIKNVHMKRHEYAEFPDAVTTRGAKHMQELALLARQGMRAVVLFIVQREDCTAFAPAADVDPGYVAALQDAMRKGVEALCYSCYVSPQEIRVNTRLPIVMDRENDGF